MTNIAPSLIEKAAKVLQQQWDDKPYMSIHRKHAGEILTAYRQFDKGE